MFSRASTLDSASAWIAAMLYRLPESTRCPAVYAASTAKQFTKGINMLTLVSEYLDIIYKIAMFLFTLWLFFDRKSDKTQKRISDLEECHDDRLDEHSERIIKLETVLEKMPTHKDIGTVYDEIRKVSDGVSTQSSSLAGIAATLDSVKEQVRLMDNFWRTHKG